MRLPDAVADNLRFLCVEVDRQLGYLQSYVDAPSTALARRIVDRRGYADNLKIAIQDGCLEFIARHKKDGTDTLVLRSVESVAADLERIAGLCRECVKQIEGGRGAQPLRTNVYSPMLARVRQSIELIEPAVRGHDTALALKISQIEQKLKRDYRNVLQHYTAALKSEKNTEDLLRALFVGHSIEQMGDALLSIGESIVAVNLGQRVNMERYHSLRESVATLDHSNTSDLQIEPIAETRSGGKISGISSAKGGSQGFVAVLKDGQKRKLNEERQRVKGWHQVFPGLAPKILDYKKRGQSASLLIEHLPGLTMEQILLHERPALLEEALHQLCATLRSVWNETRTETPISADFMGQLNTRLEDVFKIHPEFRNGAQAICGEIVSPFKQLIRRAQQAEIDSPAPFSVYIHGDFNLDNIIYDPVEQRINFIDLHRSQYMDYVQDVSVFMVSNYRLQILDTAQRRRIMGLATDFYRSANQYAEQVEDHGFHFRLALGLARSFATSTRFILDESLARRMFLRARFLIERAVATDRRKIDRFRVPIKEIFVG
jgi:phosphate uptake regulator/aminoglycoside phosphotransferase